MRKERAMQGGRKARMWGGAIENGWNSVGFWSAGSTGKEKETSFVC